MLKLLIVEDNSIEREGLKTFIDWESFGFSEVYFASNGGEGYEKAYCCTAYCVDECLAGSGFCRYWKNWICPQPLQEMPKD